MSRIGSLFGIRHKIPSVILENDLEMASSTSTTTSSGDKKIDTKPDAKPNSRDSSGKSVVAANNQPVVAFDTPIRGGARSPVAVGDPFTISPGRFVPDNLRSDVWDSVQNGSELKLNDDFPSGVGEDSVDTVMRLGHEESDTARNQQSATKSAAPYSSTDLLPPPGYSPPSMARGAVPPPAAVAGMDKIKAHDERQERAPTTPKPPVVIHIEKPLPHPGSHAMGSVMIDPQGFITPTSAYINRAVVLANLVFGAWYLYWRATDTIDQHVYEVDPVTFANTSERFMYGIPGLRPYYWELVFFAIECCLAIGVWIGQSQRLFPVQRPADLTMDDLTRADKHIGPATSVCILVPTAGEGLKIVMYCMLGVVSQRPWTGCDVREQQRVVVLDEKRRKEVLAIVDAVYAIAALATCPSVMRILRADGCESVCAQEAYRWWKEDGGASRKFLFNCRELDDMCALLEYLEDVSNTIYGGDLIEAAEDPLANAPGNNKGGGSLWMKRSSVMLSSLTEVDRGAVDQQEKIMDRALKLLQVRNSGSAEVEKGKEYIFSSCKGVPTVVYYSRMNPGTPKASPKAGNMNAAIFPIDRPGPVLIGNAKILVVNDCRHKLFTDFLQRTVPFFFELVDKQLAHTKSTQANVNSKLYKWAKIAFVQTPQHFDDGYDPLGNHAVTQYDVINRCKDGIGAVSSSGHGSLWRVRALQSSGGPLDNEPTLCKDITLVGHSFGFRSEILIEDTHTSIDMFRKGWKSIYVNNAKRPLSRCTHEPDSVEWRMKQVLRWHQGAVQLLLQKGIAYTSFGAKFPSVWHRIYAFDQATYFLQAIPGYTILMMPIIYGTSGFAPFSCEIADFFRYFTPFIVTTMLPNVIAAHYYGADTNRLARDEQVWLSTTYVQITALLSTLKAKVNCFAKGGGGDAWTVQVSTWPLYFAFCGQFVAMLGAIYWVHKDSWADGSANFVSAELSCLLAIHALWPMVALKNKIIVPSTYELKLFTWISLCIIFLILKYVADLSATTDGTLVTTTDGTSTPTPAPV